MMFHILDDLPKGIDSKYRLVIIAAKRSKQINRGARPLVNSRALKPTSIALDEVFAGRIKFESPPAEWAGSQSKQAAQETRAAWFRHIPPEELMLEEHLAPEEEKGAVEGYEAEGVVEGFQPEIEVGPAGVVEEGVLEFDPIAEVALGEEMGGVEIEKEHEGGD